MNARTCKCGCGTSLDDRRQGTVWATASCESAFRRGVAPAQRRKPHPGGAQVSFKKAIDEVAKEIAKFDTVTPYTRATAALLRALPDRQRERLRSR